MELGLIPSLKGNLSMRLIEALEGGPHRLTPLFRSESLDAPQEPLSEAARELLALPRPRTVLMAHDRGPLPHEDLGKVAQVMEPEDVFLLIGKLDSLDVRRASNLFAARGVDFADAGVVDVKGLALLVGGSEQALSAVESVVSAITPTYYLCGPAGAGQVARMVCETIWDGVVQAYAKGEELLDRFEVSDQLQREELFVFMRCFIDCPSVSTLFQTLLRSRTEPGEARAA